MQDSSFEYIGIGQIDFNQKAVALNENVVKQEQASTFHASRQQKLQKNKISAQNSRTKKKKYIQQLQRSEKLLVEQIKDCQLQLNQTHMLINQLLTKSKQNDSFNHDQKPTYQRLKFLIRSQPHYDQDQAHMLIELLINRVGVTGKQRQRMVTYYTKRLINFSIPAIYRYMLVIAGGDTGLFDQGRIGDWDQELVTVLNMTKQQTYLLNQYKTRIQREKNIWTSFFQQFNQVRSQIYNQSRVVQQNLLQLKQILSIKQIGQTIISIQNRKYNKQISLDSEQFIQKPSKKVKQQ